MRIDALGAAPLGADQALILVKAQRAGGDAEFGAQVRDREMIAVGARLDRRERLDGKHRSCHGRKLPSLYVNVKTRNPNHFPPPQSCRPEESRIAEASATDSLIRDTSSPA